MAPTIRDHHPPPWTVEPMSGGFKVVSSNGIALACVYIIAGAVSSVVRRVCVDRVRRELHISERHACVALGQHRLTQRRVPTGRDDEERLTADIIELARQRGRYGYRKIAALLRHAGWVIICNRVLHACWKKERARP